MIQADKVPAALLFSIADALGLPLHLMGEHYRGIETRDVHIGPWKITTETCVCSDILEKDIASMFARIHGRVWLYIVSTKDTLRAFVFDSSIAGIRVKDQSTYGGVSVEATLAQLTPAIKATLYYNKTSRTWDKEL